MWTRQPINFPITETDPTPQFRNAVPSLSKIKSPLGKVRLKTRDGQWSRRIGVLVDTGAVISVFTKSWCDALGLELKKGSCVKLGTAGRSKLRVYIHTVDMQIDDEVLSDIHVGFRDEEKGTSLLGRIDVFDSFEVNFRLRRLNMTFFRELS